MNNKVAAPLSVWGQKLLAGFLDQPIRLLLGGEIRWQPAGWNTAPLWAQTMPLIRSSHNQLVWHHSSPSHTFFASHLFSTYFSTGNTHSKDNSASGGFSLGHYPNFSNSKLNSLPNELYGKTKCCVCRCSWQQCSILPATQVLLHSISFWLGDLVGGCFQMNKITTLLIHAAEVWKNAFNKCVEISVDTGDSW